MNYARPICVMAGLVPAIPFTEARCAPHRDGRYGIFFAAHQIADIDLTTPKSVGDVPGLNNKPGRDMDGYIPNCTLRELRVLRLR
jgi:hypothetical protein